MEIHCSAFDKADVVSVFVEPWGAEVAIPKGSFLRLTLDGEAAEEMTVNWLRNAVMVWPWCGRPDTLSCES
jgi:hypothetical protein